MNKCTTCGGDFAFALDKGLCPNCAATAQAKTATAVAVAEPPAQVADPQVTELGAQIAGPITQAIKDGIVDPLTGTMRAISEQLDNATKGGLLLPVYPDGSTPTRPKEFKWSPLTKSGVTELTPTICENLYLIAASQMKQEMGEMLRAVDKVTDKMCLTPDLKAQAMQIMEKALAEGSDAAGGVFVPEGFRAEVIQRLPELSELMPFVRVIPVVPDSGKIPKLTTDVSVSWDEAENAAFNEVSPVLGSVSWTIHRMNALTKASRELMSDSSIGVAEWLRGLFADAVSAERDKVIAIGDGTTQPQGIASATLTQTVAIGAMNYQSMVALEHTLPKKYRRRARFIMNDVNVKRAFQTLDTQGRPIFRRAGEGINREEPTILGYPISQQDDLLDGTIFFGDLSRYIFFDREQLGVETTTEGGTAFQNHQFWIKVWEREDGKVALEEAFASGTGVLDPA